MSVSPRLCWVLVAVGSLAGCTFHSLADAQVTDPRGAQPKPVAENASVTHTHKCVHVRATQALSHLESLLASGGLGRTWNASLDKRTNTILLSGPAERIAQAKAILAKIDVAVPGQQPLLLGPPTLKTYSVPDGQAEALAAFLSKIFAKEDVRITATSKNAILVWADPEDQITIARNLQSAAPDPEIIEMIPLSGPDAPRVAETLRAMFGRVPFIEADANRNALILRGTRAQIADVKAALAVTGEGKLAGNMRVITLPEGSAVALAEAIQSAMRQMRPNPVRIIAPGQEGKKGAKDDGDNKKKTPGEVILTAFGNKLIVTCDDPQAMSLIQELVRLYVSTHQSGEFNVIRLKYAKAADAARVIDEAFNGPPGAGTSKAGPGGKGAGRPERIRVVADPGINALLIKATLLDMLTVRKMIEALDTDYAEDPAPRTHLLGPLKHAKAEEVAKVIREIYHDQRGFTISVDTRTNRLVLRAAPALRDDIERLVTELDTKEKRKEPKATPRVPEDGGPTSKSREIILIFKEGGAATLADAIRKTLEQMRPNPVRVIKPGEPDKKPSKDDGAKKVEDAPEVVIAVFDNKLVVTYDDPKILMLVQELVRLYTTTMALQCDGFLRLKFAKATAVAGSRREQPGGSRIPTFFERSIALDPAGS
jgi:type II secretory pathway component GspD/PulD (secretin)